MPPPGHRAQNRRRVSGDHEGIMDTQGLDDILNEEPVTEQAEAPAPEAAPETERPRDEHGRFLPKDTGDEQAPPAAEAAPPAAPEPATVPRAALEDERRKRQAIEQRLQMIEASFNRQPTAPPADPISFWDDPDKVLDQRLQQFGTSLIQQFEHQQQVNRVNQSEAAAKTKYPDFDEKAAEFVKQAQQNPTLIQEMAAAPDPGEYVYSRGRQAFELSQVGGDLEELKRLAVEEYKAQLLAPTRPTAPTTTAGSRSAGLRDGPEWAGPTPLSDILSR